MEKYISKFKYKHGLTEEECKKYNTQDIIYDVDMDMPVDAFEQWNEYTAKNGYISFAGWTGVDNGYTPRNVHNDGMDDLKNELNSIYKNIERTFDEFFAPFYEEGSESDSDFDFDLDEE